MLDLFIAALGVLVQNGKRIATTGVELAGLAAVVGGVAICVGTGVALIVGGVVTVGVVEWRNR